jgi:Flp pilus assembly protein TadG
MRVSLGRLRDDERGAVVMVTAIVLVVVIGMVVLVVDLGRGVAYKRQVVTGTDAAALAAAQQCALGNGTEAATLAAADVFDRNVELAASITRIEMPECDAPAGPGLRTVTVTTSASIEYFFAPIFDIHSGSIGGEAVAVWGPSTVANPIPISVSLDQLSSCGIVPNQPPVEEIQCTIEYPKDTLEEPRWGVLDMSNWNDPEAAPCHVSANDLNNIISSGGWTDDVGLNGDPPGSEPTYVCLDNGLSFSVWDSLTGGTYIFPVIDIATSLGHSPDCTGADTTCQIDTVNVVSWVVLHIVDVDQHASTVMFESITELTTGGGIPGGAFDLGVRGIRLVD